MILEHEDARVEVVELPGGRRKILVEPYDDRTFVPIRTSETSYPPALIREILAVKGPAWLCDEIARDESPNYVQFALESGLLSYLPEDGFDGKRILDFGCGAGASTAVLRRMFRSCEAVGVEQDSSLLRLAELRREHYADPNVDFVLSPDPSRLPTGIGQFDFIVMTGVVEHMLPHERKSVLPAIWGVLKSGGILFLHETPYRYFPYEGHTTGLPLINYLPDRAALFYARRLSPRNLGDCDWEALLRGGIRGSSIREILSCLEAGQGRPNLLEPSAFDGGRIGVWYHQSSRHRKSRLRDVSLYAFKALKALTGIEMTPYLTLAIRKD